MREHGGKGGERAWIGKGNQRGAEKTTKNSGSRRTDIKIEKNVAPRREKRWMEAEGVEGRIWDEEGGAEDSDNVKNGSAP